MFVEFTGPQEVLKALAEIGRTEDVQFSPDGTRLAIAGFSKGRILVLEIESLGPEGVAFSRATTLVADTIFREPHGLAWADNEVMLVANRSGQVPMIRAPRFANAPELLVHPIHTLGASPADFLHSPGAVALRPWGADLIEVLICNTYAHNVSRHYLSRDGLAIVGSETVLKAGLNVADGVAFSHSGKWVAVSNHYDNSVFLYRADDIGTVDHPAGTLRGLGYPHGLSFSPDDRAFFVADAGAPHAHMFVADDGDWAGDRIPASSIQVMDDQTFARGHRNPEEGGPKGLTVAPDGTLICMTYEEAPLVFIDIRDELARAGVTPRDRSAPLEIGLDTVRRSLTATMRRTREELAASLRREKETGQRVAGAESRAAAAEGRAAAAQERIRSLEAQAQGLEQRLRGLERNAPDIAHTRQLEQQVVGLKLEAQALGLRGQHLKRRLRLANRKLHSARTRVVRAEQRVRAVLHSTSWRLMAPLRALKRVLSRRN